MTEKISVVVPVYKAETYLDKCIKSLCAQTYQNLEIILVDDGSPDASGQICDRAAANDSRIKVIHKENGGAASARNAGLKEVTGELLAFADADDYMEESQMEILHDLLTTNEAQVAICGFHCIDEAGNVVIIDALHDTAAPSHSSEEMYSGQELILKALQGYWEYVAPWGKLFRTELYKDAKYPNWAAYEDESVFVQVFDRVEKVVITNNPLYYYVQHNGSLMNSDYSEAKTQARIEMWKERLAKFDDGNHEMLLNPTRQAYVGWLVGFLSKYSDRLSAANRKYLRSELSKFKNSLQQEPHLYDASSSKKMALKATLVQINSNILKKRYE